MRCQNQPRGSEVDCSMFEIQRAFGCASRMPILFVQRRMSNIEQAMMRFEVSDRVSEPTSRFGVRLFGVRNSTGILAVKAQLPILFVQRRMPNVEQAIVKFEVSEPTSGFGVRLFDIRNSNGDFGWASWDARFVCTKTNAQCRTSNCEV